MNAQAETYLSKIVNGASLQPRFGGPPKQIVLLSHGFGSSGADMISLAPLRDCGYQDDEIQALFATGVVRAQG